MTTAALLPLPRTAEAPARLLAQAVLDQAEADAEARADALHDGALQALVVARYATDLVVRGGDAALARDAVQDALVALRRAVWQLRPRGADGLAAALADLRTQLLAAGELAPELDVDPAADALDADAARLAYRAVQTARPERVEVRPAQGALLVRLEGGALPPGWDARAAAVGGRLDPGPVLVLPLRPEGDR